MQETTPARPLFARDYFGKSSLLPLLAEGKRRVDSCIINSCKTTLQEPAILPFLEEKRKGIFMQEANKRKEKVRAYFVARP